MQTKINLFLMRAIFLCLFFVLSSSDTFAMAGIASGRYYLLDPTCTCDEEKSPNGLSCWLKTGYWGDCCNVEDICHEYPEWCDWELGTPPADIEALKTRLMDKFDDILDYSQTAGAVVAFFHKNKNAQEEWEDEWETTEIIPYGFSDVENETSMTAETVFQVSSMSKPVSAYGVIKADSDLCDMECNNGMQDKNITDYLSPTEAVWTLTCNFPNAGYCNNLNNVTMNQIIHHNSGMKATLTPNYIIGWEVDNYANMPTTAEFLAGDNNTYLAGAVKLFNEPGEEYIYSGNAFTVLQLVIENTLLGIAPYNTMSHYQVFSEYMKNNVFSDLNMQKSSYLYTDPVVYHNTSKCYKYANWDNNGNGNFSIDTSDFSLFTHKLYVAKAACGLHTTAGDYAEFLKNVIDNDLAHDLWEIENLQDVLQPIRWYLITDKNSGNTLGVISQPEYDQITTNYPDNKPDNYPDDFNDLSIKYLDNMYNHGGALDGWHAMFYIVPEFKTGVVVLTNSGVMNPVVYYGGSVVWAEVMAAWKAMCINNFGETQ